MLPRSRSGAAPAVGRVLDVALLALLLCSAPWLARCSRSTELEPRSLVILVSIDTLRADHLGVYGYPRDTSPHIDRFAHDAVVFRQTIAQASSTLASHASMLTSLLPAHHGAFFGRGAAIPDQILTLPEVLAGQGFATAAIAGGGQLAEIYGVDQGFDLYLASHSQNFGATVRHAHRWLKNLRQRSAFLFLHTYETHHPYRSERWRVELFDDSYDGPLPLTTSIRLLEQINAGEIEIDNRDLAHIVATYDAGIHSMDQAFGRLIGHLQRMGLYDDALIVLTSDHGEEFGEHGKVGWHSHTLYDELLRVPLIIKFPRSSYRGLEVTSQVRLLDIAPTILAAVGIEIPDEFDGASLLPLLELPEAEHRPAPSQLDAGPEILSWRAPPWKLYRRRLYDLEADPEETINHLPERSRLASQLREELRTWIDRRPAPPPVQVAPDNDTKEQLRALGYFR